MKSIRIAAIIAAGWWAGSAFAAPCAGFTDVDDTSPFCTNVEWMRNRGITLGCTATTYCPNDSVTRLQMAVFMNRLANALFPLTCTTGQVMKWNGSDWACANDNAGAGGGGTVTSVAAGTGLQGSPNPITGAGSLNLAPSYQLPQGCTNGQVAKSNGAGGWTCAADAGGSGTVTSVTAGAGLATTPAGGIVGAGSVRIADGGVGTQQLADNAVTFNKIAPGHVGSVHVNPGQIQLRVNALCPRGVPLIGIAADGSPICDNPLRTLNFGTNRASVAIRADGRPLVARDGGNLYDCADAECTSGTHVILNLGDDVAMALRSDGNPVLATGNGFSQLLVICGDPACSPLLRVQRTLDSGSIGTFSTIALRADDSPVVGYFEFSSGQTRMYVCNDPSCASGTVRIVTPSPSRTPSALRIRPNGTPVVSLRDYFSGGHALYDCNDATCSSGTQRGLGGGVSSRFLLGLAARSDNRAVVANTGPVLHDCTDAACSSNTPRPFDSGASMEASAIAIRGDGRPLIAYASGFDIKLFDCSDAACSGGTARIVDQAATSYFDREIALALRGDGRPVLAYPGEGSTMRLLLCRTATCQ